MKKETVLVAVVALLAGVILGFLIGKKDSGTISVTAPVQAPGPAPMVNVQKKIDEIKNIVATDPANRNAWVALGNEYFDNNQFVDAIDAYDKALELQSDDPNVLVDQGVMFRRLGWFDRALQNFIKASELAPDHVSSFYNLGVVYRHDLQDFPRAIDAWTKFLNLNPGGPAAEQVRQEVEFMKAHPPIPKD
ncbi:MAG: tetratricopeptide repeat protein [Desulfuromonadales bacterium]|nr:tetratricopeptide repeat protein [Desulfuromonadales bacterium]